MTRRKERSHLPGDQPYPLFFADETIVRDEAPSLFFKSSFDRWMPPANDFVTFATNGQIKFHDKADSHTQN